MIGTLLGLVAVIGVSLSSILLGIFIYLLARRQIEERIKLVESMDPKKFQEYTLLKLKNKLL